MGATIVDQVRDEMTIAREEVFGPVLNVMRMEDLDHAIEIANKSAYGNGAAIFTNSGKAAREFKHRVKAGMVGINIGVPATMAMFPFTGWDESFYGDLPHPGKRRRAVLHAAKSSDHAVVWRRTWATCGRSEIPNPKPQVPKKSQVPSSKWRGYVDDLLGFGAWCFPGIWGLGFGSFSPRMSFSFKAAKSSRLTNNTLRIFFAKTRRSRESSPRSTAPKRCGSDRCFRQICFPRIHRSARAHLSAVHGNIREGQS